MSFGQSFANCGCAICTGDFFADDATQGGGGTSPSNAPTFNNDQVINQIDSGSAWSGSTINFGFLTGDPGWTQGEGSGFVQFNSAQRAATRDIMEMFDEIVAPDIVETGGNPADADINFGNTSTNIGYAHAYYPSSFWDIGGSVWLNAPGYGSLYNPQEGNYAYLTIIHEVGHAMGLSHPGSYNGGSPTYDNDAEYAQDTRQYSVMSYFSASNTGADFNGGTGWKYPQTLMVHDILTLHSIYGADTDTRNTNTTYGFNSNAGKDIYDFSQNQTPVLTIYDAGGIDTLDLSGFSQRAIVDLTPGAYSSVGGISNTMTYNLGIAYETWIENAIGGSGNDTITGNDLNNVLTGGDGADQLFGGAGDDLLNVDIHDTVVEGGSGHDRVVFYGTENFSFNLSGTGVEYVRSKSGNDTLDGSGMSVNIQLFGEDGNDNLTGGSAKDYLDGGSGADTLIGGADDDKLIGGAGADEMYGGAGDDLLVVDTLDTVIDGGSGRDRAVYYGTDSFNFSLSGSGIEYFRSDAGNDNLDATGMTESVWLFGQGGNDVLTGGDENDHLDGGSGNDTINGGAGNDTLIGGSGADQLSGGSGNDLLVVDINDTLIEGGSGHDRVVFQGTQDFDFSLLGTGVEYVRAKSGNDDLDATGVTSNVQLFGEAGNDTLTGGNAKDYLDGGSGADVLSGGDDDDKLIGGDGADELYGGDGNDLLVVDTLDTVINGGAGHDRAVYHGTENFSFTLLGTEIEYVRSNSGNDTLDASGVTSNVQLFGEDGNDVLTGGLGNDIFYGGSGTDKFVFKAGSGSDTIADWQDGVDIIDFSMNADVAAIDDLVVTDDGSDARISFGGNSILVLGAAGQIEETDFDFV